MQESNTPPLTARSVLASALLGMDPPELPVAQLVRLTGLFGISENRARVALSRMVAGGEATTDGSGRYRLAGHLMARRSRQSASRSGVTTDYAGQWRLAVVTTSGSTADVRSERRRALSYARLAELREGVWMRPANVAVRLPRRPAGSMVMSSSCRPDRRTPVGWSATVGPGGWADRARSFALVGLSALPPVGPEALAPGFELSAAVLRHLQADPLLPEALLPSGWPGHFSYGPPTTGGTRDIAATLREWSRAAAP